VKLDIRHTFPVTPDEFWAMFWDDEFERRNAQGSTMLREMLSEHMDGPIRVQRWRYTSTRPVPAPMAKLLGVDRISYEQDNRYDPVAKQLVWKVIPMAMADKVTAEGVFSVRPIGKTDCERIVSGTIEVRVMFVGGKVEQMILDAVTSAYETGAAQVRAFIPDWRAKQGNPG
jgi:hypothetical protein